MKEVLRTLSIAVVIIGVSLIIVDRFGLQKKENPQDLAGAVAGESQASTEAVAGESQASTEAVAGESQASTEAVAGESQASTEAVAINQSVVADVVPPESTTRSFSEEVAGIGLDKISFRSGGIEFTRSSYYPLSQLYELLLRRPEVNIQIVGHTDSKGAYKRNLELSIQRAKAVKDFLVEELGISEARISAIGEGSAKPIATNETAEGRERNRRIEVEEVKPASVEIP